MERLSACRFGSRYKLSDLRRIDWKASSKGKGAQGTVTVGAGITTKGMGTVLLPAGLPILGTLVYGVGLLAKMGGLAYMVGHVKFKDDPHAPKPQDPAPSGEAKAVVDPGNEKLA